MLLDFEPKLILTSSSLLTALPISPRGEIFRKPSIICLCSSFHTRQSAKTRPDHISSFSVHHCLLNLINTRHTYEQTSHRFQPACRRRTIHNPGLASSSHKMIEERKGKTHPENTPLPLPPFHSIPFPPSSEQILRLQNLPRLRGG